ncbi:DNA N-6-adenine-methyltransferase [Sphingobium sp. WW5]|uniref:DNA N-6-adenine-methyltransferase n=1 Tax=unclassified Sphingobium TaxID=2611147 RepID=UPI003C23B64C
MTLNLIQDLAAARREKGLSQTQLAGLVDADRQAIARLEGGVGPVHLLLRVMTALHYHVSGLARGSTLPDQMRNRRNVMSLSVDELARRAGISPTTLITLENGRGTIAPLTKVMAVIQTSRTERRKPNLTPYLPAVVGERDSRFTPAEFVSILEMVWGRIDLDPCGHVDSPVRAVRKILLSDGGDGLRDEWSGRFVYVNPPFSSMTSWLRRADMMWSSGSIEKVVALVPARTDSAYFHDRIAKVCDIGFLRGRMQFARASGRSDKASRVPFPLMVCVWGATPEEIQAFDRLSPCQWLAKADGRRSLQRLTTVVCDDDHAVPALIG